MTDALRKAAQMALESDWDYRQAQAITALRAALAQPEPFNPDWSRVKALEESLREHMAEIHRLKTLAQPEQEPVAYLWQHSETGRTRVLEKDQVWTASNPWKRVGPLYLHSPQRQPLTGEQLRDVLRECPMDVMATMRLR